MCQYPNKPAWSWTHAFVKINLRKITNIHVSKFEKKHVTCLRRWNYSTQLTQAFLFSEILTIYCSYIVKPVYSFRRHIENWRLINILICGYQWRSDIHPGNQNLWLYFHVMQSRKPATLQVPQWIMKAPSFARNVETVCFVYVVGRTLLLFHITKTFGFQAWETVNWIVSSFKTKQL